MVFLSSSSTYLSPKKHQINIFFCLCVQHTDSLFGQPKDKKNLSIFIFKGCLQKKGRIWELIPTQVGGSNRYLKQICRLFGTKYWGVGRLGAYFQKFCNIVNRNGSRVETTNDPTDRIVFVSSGSQIVKITRIQTGNQPKGSVLQIFGKYVPNLPTPYTSSQIIYNFIWAGDQTPPPMLGLIPNSTLFF